MNRPDRILPRHAPVCRRMLLSMACAGHLLTSGCQERSPAAPTAVVEGGAAGASAVETTVAAPVADSAGVFDVTFDDVAFEMEKTEPFHRSLLTEAIEKMNGQTIRIRGFILPTPIQNGITEFVLVRDNMECCFGLGAALYDCILVNMESGKSTSFSIRPVTVEGRFRIEEFPPSSGREGNPLAIYQMQARSVN
jgi:hypothetical protein